MFAFVNAPLDLKATPFISTVSRGESKKEEKEPDAVRWQHLYPPRLTDHPPRSSSDETLRDLEARRGLHRCDGGRADESVQPFHDGWRKKLRSDSLRINKECLGLQFGNYHFECASEGGKKKSHNPLGALV